MTERALMPDYLRLIALFGIVVVNVELLAYPFELGALPQVSGIIDEIAMWLVYGLAAGKSYTLFSFMFGLGLAYQMQSADRSGVPFGKRYRNRMLGLFLLGALHAVFFYSGDILMMYAALGGLLYLLRNWEPRRLIRWGIALIVVQTAISLVPLAIPVSAEADYDPVMLQLETFAFETGGFWDAAGVRAVFAPIFFGVGLALQGVSTLAWFCLGLAAVKSGVIDQPDHPIWVRARRWLIPGVALSLLFAGLAIWTDDFDLWLVATYVAAPIATVGYLGVIARIARPAGRLMMRALRIGANSLTIYLGQSILLSFVFAGYGLGLWNALPPAQAVLISVLVTVLLMVALSLWLTKFRQGPFEMLLRWFTYRVDPAPKET